MKVGITGTREGMNDHQVECVYDILTEILAECTKLEIRPEFHHGDCTGVDEQAAIIAKELGYKIVCHPPESNYLRAHVSYDESRKPLGYFQRDRNIVDETEVLIVVPLHNEWQSKGGTWYTASYARKLKKPYTIFYPDGRVEISD